MARDERARLENLMFWRLAVSDRVVRTSAEQTVALSPSSPGDGLRRRLNEQRVGERSKAATRVGDNGFLNELANPLRNWKPATRN